MGDREGREIQAGIGHSAEPVITVAEFCITKKNGNWLIYSPTITYGNLSVPDSAAIKAMEVMILQHHINGVDVTTKPYVQSVKMVLTLIRNGAAEAWGYANE
jgi:hypothetical protein